MKLVRILYVLFIFLSIGVAHLLAALSYIFFTTKTGYGWLIASIICGLESLTIAVLVVVCVVQFYCKKKIQRSLPEGEAEDYLKTPYSNISESNVTNQQENEGDYVEYFNFMKADQSSEHLDYCRAHVCSVCQSSCAFCEDAEMLDRKLTSKNEARGNLQTSRNICDMLVCQTHAKVLDESGIVPLTNGNTKNLNTVSDSSKNQAYVSLTKYYVPDVYPDTFKLPCLMKSTEYVQDSLPLPFAQETFAPTHIKVLDSNYICQNQSDRHSHTVRISESPIAIHDTSGTLSDISSTQSENFCPIHEEDGHYWVPNNSPSSEWNSEDSAVTD